jgi:hypothetical protein
LKTTITLNGTAHKLGVSEDVALALESHVDQYAAMKVLNELRRSDRSFGAFGGMGFEPGAGAAALSGSIPAKILHYILTYLFRKKVDHLVAKAFLDLFMLDEETFMSNPIKLEQKMRDHFGNKEGTAIFSQFYDMVQTRLGPSQQFGGPQRGGGGGGLSRVVLRLGRGRPRARL